VKAQGSVLPILSIVLCLVLLAVLLIMVGSDSHAQDCTLYVSSDGNCGGKSPCFATIQGAVDAADRGNIIKVAGGRYTGVHSRLAPPGYAGPTLITQVVYISEAITLRGGYTTSYADPPDPRANRTTIDAEGKGRVLFIAGEVTPTVEGMRITGGDAGGLDGWGFGWDAGGGVYIMTATATISNNIVSNNTARGGGGLFLYQSAATLTDNTVSTNTASWSGGGLYLLHSDAKLSGNQVYLNTATEFDGGGLVLSYSDATLSANTVMTNTANSGGGLYLSYSNALLEGNTVMDNTSIGGGSGFALYHSDATLAGNIIRCNIAGGHWGIGGGGLLLRESDAVLRNNVVADNQASAGGSGLYIRASAPRLWHTTIACNSGGDGTGIYATDDGTLFSSVVLTNTILVSHTVGLHVTSGSMAVLQNTLWNGNTTDWNGAGTIGHIHDYSGDPAFVDVSMQDYHIGPASAAIDKGVNAGVTTDIDGNPRPVGDGHDLGADEFPAALQISKDVDCDLVKAGTHLTFTLHVTNTGCISLTAIVTDFLPSHVSPTGLITWVPVVTAPDGVWTQTVSVTVQADYSGPLTNTLLVSAAEGPTAAVTCAAIAEVPVVGLVASSDSPTVLGDSTTLTATISAGAHVTYTWAFGDGALGFGAVVTHNYPSIDVYTPVVTAENSVSLLTATTPVTIVEIPIAGLTAANDSPTILGDTTTLTATINDGSNVTYTWALGDNERDYGALVSHTYAAAGMYLAVVTASNSTGLVTATTPVRVDEVIAGLAATNDSPTPRGYPTTLTATTAAGSNITYTWAFGDGSIGSGAVVSHSYPVTGIFEAVVAAGNSVSLITATTAVTIEEAIVGLEVTNSGATRLGSVTALTASVEAGSNVVYDWAFGDGQTAVGTAVTHTYLAAGVYDVVVRASSEQFCQRPYGHNSCEHLSSLLGPTE